MRFTQPVNENQALPYSAVKLQGCTDLTVGFNLLKEEPTVSARRYCNKVLVHECVPVPVADPMDIVRAELMATDDPGYKFFNIFKSSEVVDTTPASITIQTDTDGKAIGFVVSFAQSETCCLPLRMAFRFYGYFADDSRILLANGNLLVTPCSCYGTGGVTDPSACGANYWTDIAW